MAVIANATTEVVVERSLTEVQTMLRKAGARRIQVTYAEDPDALDPVGVAFELATPHGTRAYALPVEVAGVAAALGRARVAPRYATTAHASRVAWRIARDWLRAQLALIEAEVAQAEQVMLPYLVVGQDDTGQPVTVYDRYVAQAGHLAAIEGAP